MTTDPRPLEPADETSRESWSSPLSTPEGLDDGRDLHPRADGEDVDFEEIEMQHRSMSVQR